MKCDHKHPRVKLFLRLGMALLVAVSLPIFSGCHHSRPLKYSNLTPISPIDSLRANGVQIIHLGQTYRLVIASSQLFNTDSANLREDAKGILNDVARLLNAHHVVVVKVAVYSDNIKAGARKNALTARQAAVVSNFLSDLGLNVRLLYGDGQGSKHPVAWNGTQVGRHTNRRVEISFMVIPKTTIYESISKA